MSNSAGPMRPQTNPHCSSRSEVMRPHSASRSTASAAESGFRVVQREETFGKVLVVAVAVGAALQRPDLVVDAFQRTGRDRILIPIEQAAAVFLQRLGHRLQLTNAGGCGAAAPGVEEFGGGLLGLLPPEFSQVVL